MKTEAQTREELIDAKLIEAGWDVNNLSQVIKEFDICPPRPSIVAEPHEHYGEHQFCDYILLGKDGKTIAVVEAKKTTKDPATGREQAKQYCYKGNGCSGFTCSCCHNKKEFSLFLFDTFHNGSDCSYLVITSGNICIYKLFCQRFFMFSYISKTFQIISCWVS